MGHLSFEEGSDRPVNYEYNNPAYRCQGKLPGWRASRKGRKEEMEVYDRMRFAIASEKEFQDSPSKARD